MKKATIELYHFYILGQQNSTHFDDKKPIFRQKNAILRDIRGKMAFWIEMAAV